MENTIKITALSKDDTVRILHKAGSRRITAELLDEDIEAGAPVNPDGTINLIHYAAWLAKETGQDAG